MERAYSKEQVIAGLKACSDGGKGCRACPFEPEGSGNCLSELCAEACRLLTEDSGASDQGKHETKER